MDQTNERQIVQAPVVEVTLLEDRALVRRRVSLQPPEGLSRWTVEGVAPVLQDVSLRAEVIEGSGRVTDARTRRALRVLSAHRPEEVRALEARIEELQVALRAQDDARQRGQDRLDRLGLLLEQALEELPVDAAWGTLEPAVWEEVLEPLFERARTLELEQLDRYHAQIDQTEEAQQLLLRRQGMARPDQAFEARVELDITAPAAGSLVVELTYAVPNALWRPLHQARLVGEDVTFQASAAVWQNTGEDWTGVQLIFSTARASLGHEPPLLRSDLLQARPRSAGVQVQARQVEVQSAAVRGPGGGAPPPPGPQHTELPGVDDGGDLQSLRAMEPATLPSDGRPSLIPLFRFTTPAELERVAWPEFDAKPFLRAVLLNKAKHPLLAGPVELVRGSETIGWTSCLFVAPEERFELSFGPEYEVRILRDSRLISAEVDAVDRWTRRLTELNLYLSNLTSEAQELAVQERIPVSEVEHVRVQLIEEGTNYMPELDEDGFCRWKALIPPYERRQIVLRWELALAPDVSMEGGPGGR